ncbi:Uncharacterised protein [Mycobacterium tuberculosis]|uniref:Uncharacterized protein n=1 Tax=Mycobacterium tuberculosis TaxID=1773 RepID=A0A916LDZ3_MYCTX|nr:Uncharacterised protein [Mycobacterium tuberculosis]
MRRARNSGSLPSTQENTMSMSNTTSLACGANIPSRVGHLYP